MWYAVRKYNYYYYTSLHLNLVNFVNLTSNYNPLHNLKEVSLYCFVTFFNLVMNFFGCTVILCSYKNLTLINI